MSLSKRLDQARKGFLKGNRHLSALALIGLCAARVRITRNSPWRSGLEKLVVGGPAADVAFAFGALLKGLGG